jgi:hypothetical protein
MSDASEVETPNRLIMLGHELEFSGCNEVCQGGPLACTLTIDGWLVERRNALGSRSTSLRFDPFPLEYEGSILVPVRKSNILIFGYALARIDPDTCQVSVISKVHEYMKLLRIERKSVVFATKTYGSETGTIGLR